MTCTLCQNELTSTVYQNETERFCCAGCQAVYSILALKNELSDFKNHPLFQQAVQSGLISNPLLLEQLRDKVERGERKKWFFEVGDLFCSACATVISLILQREKGVIDCQVDFATDIGFVQYDPCVIGEEEITKRIQQLGYHVIALEEERKKENKPLNFRFFIAALFSLNTMMFSYAVYASYFYPSEQGQMFTFFALISSLPVFFYAAFPIYRRFWSCFWVGIVGMEALIVLGVSSAFLLSVYNMAQGSNHVYFDSASVVITFVLLGKVLEMRAKFSAKRTLLRLYRGLPRKARKKDGTIVLLKEVKKGDEIIVLMGEKVPLDGILIEGEGAVDESIISGESVPVLKRRGDAVLGGSLLKKGSFVMEASGKKEGSLLHLIAEMVGNNLQKKKEEVALIDRLSVALIPAVILLAAVVGFWAGWARAASILLISCPCAIGIAAPMAESYLLSGLAAIGVFVQNRGALSVLGKETVFVFDKTGVVTEGKFSLLDGLGALSLEDLAILKGLAKRSIHPICLSIAEAIGEPAKEMAQVEEIAGKGMRGEGAVLGSGLFFRELGIHVPSEDDTMTTVYFARNGKLLAQLALGDKIREKMPELIQSLGCKTVLLSGDGKKVVEEVAKKCGFSNFYAEHTPLQKQQVIEELKKRGEVVAMMGDGINDAPALSACHVSFSVPNATDLSIQASDVLLQNLNLLEIRTLCEKGRKILRQNLFWAFFYNGVGVFLAVAGYLTPIFSAFAMITSSLMVLLNARRLTHSNRE